LKTKKLSRKHKRKRRLRKLGRQPKLRPTAEEPIPTTTLSSKTE
jgi:ribosomal protein S8E